MGRDYVGRVSRRVAVARVELLTGGRESVVSVRGRLAWARGCDGEMWMGLIKDRGCAQAEGVAPGGQGHAQQHHLPKECGCG